MQAARATQTRALGRLDNRRTLPTLDGLPAATALVHGRILVSGDTRAQAGVGVELLDPFGSRAG